MSILKAPPAALSRRQFCMAAGAAALVGASARAQSLSPTHPDVAAVDHDRILAAAAPLLTQPPAPITAFPAPRSHASPNDFYSEPEDVFPDPASPSAPWKRRFGAVNPDAFTAHRDAVYAVSVAIAALTAAFVLTADTRYAAHAADHLRAWFLTPATRMNPSLDLCHRTPNASLVLIENRYEGIFDTVPFAEIAQSIPFLAASEALTPTERDALHAWFAAYLQWLTDSRLASLARDQKDHHASSWLLQAVAFARLNTVGFTSDDTTLALLRHRFHAVTLRAEIVAAGYFPREVNTSAPYRNSLMNLDLLCAAADLLSTRFERVWDYELQDGPGLRAVIAWHVPHIASRATWPYPADDVGFSDLPGRRPALLLAGRAYNRPEYTQLWSTLSPIPPTAPLEIRRSLPISQPLLWVAHPKPVATSALLQAPSKRVQAPSNRTGVV